ncbi:MAG: aspartyl protease family protein [Phycisphaeraceae bacterium]|nr:aspartyl protease family protein [Phycisphaeraceae bacterium]
MRIRLLALCLAFIAPASTGAPPEAVRLDAEIVTLPFDPDGGAMTFEARINGQGPFRLNLDTYASVHLCLDTPVAERLGLPVVGTTLNSDGVSARMQRLFRVERLDIGGATIEGLHCLEGDYSWVRGGDGRRVDGLIGFELFEQLLLTIDGPAGEVRIQRGELDPRDESVMEMLADNGAPHARFAIGDRSYLLGLDSGFPGWLLMPEGGRDQPRIDETDAAPRSTRGVNGTRRARTVRLADPLEFAGERLEDVPVVMIEGMARPLMGHSIMKRARVTFDQASGLVRVVSGAFDDD